MLPVIDLGPFALQTSGLCLILCLWIGIWITRKFSVSLATNHNAIEDSLFLGLIAGIISARIGFFLQNSTIFLDNPLSLIALTPTMLNTTFGLMVGILSIFIYAQRKHLPLWPTLDTITPLLIFIFAGVHLSNLATGNAYGLPTRLPWGVDLWNKLRHPVQVYALILTLALCIWFMVNTNKLKETGFLKSGTLTQWVLASLAFITLFTHTFVEEKTRLAGIDLVQIVSVIILIGDFVLLYQRLYSSTEKVIVFISLGSNIDPIDHLVKALLKISEKLKIRAQSGLYKTQDVTNKSDPPFYYNLSVEIETDLPYPALKNELTAIESAFGRIKGNKQQVPLDIDILTYNRDVFSYKGKRIPDNNLTKYIYILKPLSEIAPEFRHPATGVTIQEISKNIKDETQDIEKIGEVENGIMG